MQYSTTPVRKYSIAASTSNAAGATTTGTAVDMVPITDPRLLIKLNNGATGPTISAKAEVQVQLSRGGAWVTIRRIDGGTTANAETLDFFTLPPCVAARVVVSGNTVQGVTCEASVIAYIK